jgi:hypothetical protein
MVIPHSGMWLRHQCTSSPQHADCPQRATAGGFSGLIGRSSRVRAPPVLNGSASVGADWLRCKGIADHATGLRKKWLWSRGDDMALLRHGAMGTVFDRPYASSTLGSFLRAFAFGHVRQLDAVASRLLVGLHARTPLLSGMDGSVCIDLD